MTEVRHAPELLDLKANPTDCEGGSSWPVRHMGTGTEGMPLGIRTTAQALSESPEAMGVSGTWALVVFRQFLHDLSTAKDVKVDVRIAASAALQDLEAHLGQEMGK